MSKYDMLPCTDARHISDSECRYAHKRLKTEAAMVRGLIRGLKAEGYRPVCTFDGAEYVDGTTETATLDTVFSVDESTITFEGKNGTHHKSDRWGVNIVLGNGVDCIPNWNVSRDATDPWNEAIERVADELYERHEND